ncbi:MAG: glycosyltransferase family 1 protein [bacterium]|jgi:glycosyltransferase involved in cell wall biosynthesis|nr:glycosyltransferase family 4 protein [candidate division KSB1 bacterium]MDH7559573.1 glycosyltransferase family 1 protein [bacterium]
MRRVGINAIVLNQWSGGLGVYLRHLIDYLLREEVPFQPVVFTASDFAPPPAWQQAGAIVRTPVKSFRPIMRIAKEALFWKRLLARHKIDLLHSPISYVPLGVTVPTAVTIHDLRWFHLPRACGPVRHWYLRAMIRRSAMRACHIFTVSEFSKRDIVQVLGIPEARVSAIPEGFDPTPFSRPQAAARWDTVQQRYGLSERYILSVGHLEPHKNFVRLIEAFRRLVDQEHQELRLVIVGKKSWGTAEVYRAVEELDLGSRVVIAGFVADQDLPAVYQHAQLFVAPSLFEGFGFTPLESMAAGVPVAAARATSLPEIVGDAAILFDPYDVAEMAQAMARLLHDQELRRTLVAGGYQNLRRFDWRTCCVRTADELARLVHSVPEVRPCR